MLVASTESAFSINSATSNCERIRLLKDHVMIGISPFNSKFSDDYIERLLLWVSGSFSNFDFLLPGLEASFLLEATGKTPTSVARKTRHELNRNMKSIHRAMAVVGAGRLWPQAGQRVLTLNRDGAPTEVPLGVTVQPAYEWMLADPADSGSRAAFPKSLE